MTRHKHHDMHRALADAFAAGNAEILVDHVDALRVLCDGMLRADARAFSALDAGKVLELSVAQILKMYAGILRIRLLIKSLSTGYLAGFTSGAVVLIYDDKLLHFQHSFSAFRGMNSGFSITQNAILFSYSEKNHFLRSGGFFALQRRPPYVKEGPIR